MSMHKIPLTELERNGLEKHGLAIGTPSQLSDAFRQGVAWALAAPQPERKPLTDDQAKQLLQKTHGAGVFLKSDMKTVRAIEAAHGIGGKA